PRCVCVGLALPCGVRVRLALEGGLLIIAWGAGEVSHGCVGAPCQVRVCLALPGCVCVRAALWELSFLDGAGEADLAGGEGEALAAPDVCGRGARAPHDEPRIRDVWTRGTV